MKASLVIGVVLLVLGISTALFGMLNVGEETLAEVESTSVQFPIGGPIWYVAVPIVSGLSLALGSLLIGLSMGNWRNPRSQQRPGDEVVDPEGHHKMKHV